MIELEEVFKIKKEIQELRKRFVELEKNIYAKRIPDDDVRISRFVEFYKEHGIFRIEDVLGYSCRESSKLLSLAGFVNKPVWVAGKAVRMWHKI